MKLISFYNKQITKDQQQKFVIRLQDFNIKKGQEIMQSVRQQRQISQLINENHSLKARLNKLGEIQSYIDVLVSNNRNYQEQLSILQNENRKLRNHVEQQVAKRLHQQSSHQTQVSCLRKNYDIEINGLVSELKSILKDREQMQVNHQSVIEELQMQYKNQIAIKRAQIEQVDMEYQNKINKLNSLVKEQQRDLDVFARELKQAKIQHLEEVDILNSKIRFLNENKSQMQADLTKSHRQIEIMAKQVKQLSFQTEQASTKCLTIQQQKNDMILQLKKQNKRLVSQLDKMTTNFKNIQDSYQQAHKKLNSVTNQYEQLRRERNQLQAQGRKNVRAIEQTQYIINNTRQKLKAVQESFSKEDRRNKEIIQQLQNINGEVRRKLDDSNRENIAKTEEIKDLLQSIEKIELKMSHYERQNSRLIETNMKNKQQIHFEQSTIQENELEIRSLRQKLALYQSHNATLQEMMEKEKRRIANLEMNRREISKVAGVERDISGKYEIQIKRLIHQFECQKNAMLQQHNMERQRLKQLYQYTLINKEDLFNRKLELLESQIQSLRVGMI